MRFRLVSRRTCLPVALFIVSSAAAPAADCEYSAAARIATPSGPQTLTGDRFSRVSLLRDASFDFRLEWSLPAPRMICDPQNAAAYAKCRHRSVRNV